MKKLLFVFLLLIISCDKSKSDYQIIPFSKSSEINFFDFETLTNDNTEVVFKNYNCKKGSLDTDYGKASIFLIDINENNTFNDLEDIITIGDFNLDSPKSFNINNTIGKTTLFALNKKIVQFHKIEKKTDNYFGEFKIVDKPIDSVKKQNRQIDKLPSLNFLSVSNDSLNLKDFKGKNKFIYIEFWTSWCSPCIQHIPTLKKIHSEFNKEVEIISLNGDGDRVNPEKFKNIIVKYDMSWLQGVTNDDIKREMDFNVYPRGYLFKSDGELISSEYSPSQLLKFLNSK